MLPRISVIIPVLNSVKTFAKAIESILYQHYPNVELIILDGESNDGTLDIIKHYHNHISYWHSQRDGSPGLAINLGIQRATGELIAQLMADDWFLPGIFHAVAKQYQKTPHIDVISCGGMIVREKAGDFIIQNRYTTQDKLTINLNNICYGIPAMSSRFLTKKFIKKIGILVPFDQSGKHYYCADRELLLRAAILGCEEKIISEVGHVYLAHEASATFGPQNKIRIFLEHRDVICRYLKNYHLTLKQKYFLTNWYHDQTLRLMFYQCLARDFRNASISFQDSCKISLFKTYLGLIKIPLQTFIKRLWQRMQLFTADKLGMDG